MLRITQPLFAGLFLLCTHAWSQEIIADVEQKYGTGVSEVFFMGDTTFVRIMWAAETTARPGSTSTWYSGNTLIGQVDLMALGRDNLIAIKKYGDSLYYFSADDAGKKIDINIYRGAGLSSTPVLVSKTTVYGVLVNALDYGGELMVITWERKAAIFHLYAINRGRLVNTRDLKLPKDLTEIREKDIVFIDSGDQSRVSSSAAPFKVFFYDDTFCAVYDDTWREYNTVEKPGYKTRTFRKNLVTGKEDNDLFFTADRYAFKSYLKGKDGKDLYRIVTTKEDVTLFVHDLDSNKLVMKQKIVVPEDKNDKSGFIRMGAAHKISEGQAPDLKGYMATDALDIGIIVDDYQGEQVLTFGSINNMKGVGFPVPVVSPVRVAIFLVKTAVKLMRDDPNTIRYQYLKGTPQTGFKVLPTGEASDLIKIRIDEFELKEQMNGDIDHLSYFASDKYWIAIYSHKKSPRFTIVKFPVKP
jgi:hypothetical protein